MDNRTASGISLPPQGAPKRTNIRRIVLLFFLLAAAGACGFFLFAADFLPPAQQPLAQTKSLPKQPATVEKAAVPNSGKNVGQAQIAAVPQSGNLSEMTTLVAIREKLKIQKDIETLRKQIDDLFKPPVVAPPVVMKPPYELKKEDETARQRQESEKAKADAETKAALLKRHAEFTTITSIQGINGALTATIRNGKGESSTLRKGSLWNGGTVVSISRDGVTLEKNGKHSTVRFMK